MTVMLALKGADGSIRFAVPGGEGWAWWCWPAWVLGKFIVWPAKAAIHRLQRPASLRKWAIAQVLAANPSGIQTWQLQRDAADLVEFTLTGKVQ